MGPCGPGQLYRRSWTVGNGLYCGGEGVTGGLAGGLAAGQQARRQSWSLTGGAYSTHIRTSAAFSAASTPNMASSGGAIR